MKKACLVLLLVFSISFATGAAAEVDLSSMSFDELVQLNQQVVSAIMQHEDFDCVTVPMGLYKVGADIPAGQWMLKSADGGMADITFGTSLKGNELNQFDSGNKNYSMRNDESCLVTLVDGQYVQIDYSEIVFSSYSGSASLGFKKK